MQLHVRYGKGAPKLRVTKMGSAEVMALEPWHFVKENIDTYMNDHQGSWFLQAKKDTLVTFRTGVYISAEQEHFPSVISNTGIQVINSKKEQEVFLKHMMRAGEVITSGTWLGTIVMVPKEKLEIIRKE